MGRGRRGKRGEREREEKRWSKNRVHASTAMRLFLSERENAKKVVVTRQSVPKQDKAQGAHTLKQTD